MKAGFAAATLVGAATANPGYWPAPVSSIVKLSASSSASWAYSAKNATSRIWAPTGSLSSKPISPSKIASAEKWAVPDFFNPQFACCKTVTTVTVYGSDTAAPAKPTTTSSSSSTISAFSSTAYITVAPVNPAPYASVWAVPSAGVYSQEAETVTVTSTITVVAMQTTTLSAGNNWYGGVTTSVTESTTVTCPYAAESTSGGSIYQHVATTTYVCPSAGVWTPVPAVSTYCPEATTLIYDVVTSYEPGVWIKPATTFTATTAGQVWYCPYQAPAKPSPMPEQPIPVPVYSAPVAPVKPSAPAAVPAPYVPAQAAYAPAVVSVAPAAPAKSSASASSSNISPNGDKWAMTYTPYTKTGQCKTAAEVDADIAKIAGYGFSTVRLYATDCGGLENVGGSCKKHGLKIILGVFIEKSGLGAVSGQVDAISAWGKSGHWDVVAMIVIGNEAIFNGYCGASELASFISTCKGTWASSGYTGPVTTTEPVDVIQKYASTLCPVVDVAGANIQPFFTSTVAASGAGSFVNSQLALVEAACGKPAYNLECGWPSQGTANGDAVPGVAYQKTAIADVIAKAGSKTVIFSFDDDEWKDGGSFGVEKSFGCGSIFSASW